MVDSLGRVRSVRHFTYYARSQNRRAGNAQENPRLNAVILCPCCQHSQPGCAIVFYAASLCTVRCAHS